jgi:hypothetical protein
MAGWISAWLEGGGGERRRGGPETALFRLIDTWGLMRPIDRLQGRRGLISFSLCHLLNPFHRRRHSEPSPYHTAAAATLSLSVPPLWQTLPLPYCRCGNPSSICTAAIANPLLAILPLRQPFLFLYRRYSEPSTYHTATPATLPLCIPRYGEPSPCHTATAATLPLSMPLL